MQRMGSPCGLLPRSLHLDPLVKDSQEREGVPMLGVQQAPPLPAADAIKSESFPINQRKQV